MKVLISAYACEPHKGSEPGAGWNWSLAAARDHEVWVLTRVNNRQAIETELARRPQPSLRFVYVDLPPWARRWKRGQRGVRVYYLLWQLVALRMARQLHGRERFDLVHHVTFANAHLPPLVGFTDAPFVFGPVDAGITIPIRLYSALGPRGVMVELRTIASRWVAVHTPPTRRLLRRATVVIAQNDESAQRLKRDNGQVLVRPNASVEESSLGHCLSSARRPEKKMALAAGRLIAWKGMNLAIAAIALLPEWRLQIIGSGPEIERLQRMSASLGLAERVEFIPWLPQQELWSRMAAASVVVVPSLRDAANLVVAEARTIGCPVVAFDQGGPRAMQRLDPEGIRLISRSSTAEMVEALAQAIHDTPATSREASSAFIVSAVADTLAQVYASAKNRGHSAKLDGIDWRHARAEDNGTTEAAARD